MKTSKNTLMTELFKTVSQKHAKKKKNLIATMRKKAISSL